MRLCNPAAKTPFFPPLKKAGPVPKRFSFGAVAIGVLDHAVKPVLIIFLCVAGLIFEFLLELPFIVLIGLQRAASGRNR